MEKNNGYFNFRHHPVNEIFLGSEMTHPTWVDQLADLSTIVAVNKFS